jgi:hypothetical protein
MNSLQAGSAEKDTAGLCTPHDAQLPSGFTSDVLPNIEALVVQDEAPMESVQKARNKSLLVDSLHTSWTGPSGPGSFVALANVALFYAKGKPPVVPDVMLSLDINWSGFDLQYKKYQSYFLWIIGKVPDIVIDIVWEADGHQDGQKKRDYTRLGVPYYAVYDPWNLLNDGALRLFERRGSRYTPLDSTRLEDLGLGLTLWQGKYQNVSGTWVRWCDKVGQLLLTGEEATKQEQDRAEREKQRADTVEKAYLDLRKRLSELATEGKQGSAS